MSESLPVTLAALLTRLLSLGQSLPTSHASQLSAQHAASVLPRVDAAAGICSVAQENSLQNGSAATQHTAPSPARVADASTAFAMPTRFPAHALPANHAVHESAQHVAASCPTVLAASLMNSLPEEQELSALHV